MLCFRPVCAPARGSPFFDLSESAALEAGIALGYGCEPVEQSYQQVLFPDRSLQTRVGSNVGCRTLNHHGTLPMRFEQNASKQNARRGQSKYFCFYSLWLS